VRDVVDVDRSYHEAVRMTLALRCISISLLLVAPLPALLWGAQAQDTLAGAYTVTGANEDGSSYTGRAQVTDTDGILRIEMSDEQGVASIAIGLREGNVVSVIFQTREGAVGVAIYRLEQDRWIGRWTLPGSDVVLTETLTKVDPRLHGAETGPKTTI
jgi:hypothetical protein